MQSIVAILRAGGISAWRLVALGGGFVLQAAAAVVPAILTGRLFDALYRPDALQHVARLAVWFGAVTIVLGAASLALNYAFSVTRERFAFTARIAMMETLQHAQIEATSQLTFGEVTNRIVSDVEHLANQMQYWWGPLLQSTFAVGATVVAMFVLDARMTAVALAVTALAFVPGIVSMRRMHATSRAQAAAKDAMSGHIAESASLSALMLLRHPVAAAHDLRRLRAAGEDVRRYGLAQDRLTAAVSFANTIAGTLGPAAVLVFGAWLVVQHAMTAGTIVTFLILQGRLGAPASVLSNAPNWYAIARVTATRLLEIFILPRERGGAQAFSAGAIVARGVSVSRGESVVVRGVDFTIAAGAHVALAGPSGAGKSTLAMLLTRFIDPSEGELSIGTVRIADISLDALRANVVIVAQDPLVLDTTLRQNLTFAAPDATPQAIDDAIELCGLREVVDSLPDGLDTRLGQRGFRLSGGERQRICLARAVLQGPRILVLDEALSGVDMELEGRILAHLRKRMRDKTLIVITHRLPAIADFDDVLLLESGRVTMHGPHAQLLAASAWYRTAFERGDTPLCHPEACHPEVRAAGAPRRVRARSASLEGSG